MKHTDGPWTAKRRDVNWCVAFNFDYGDSQLATVWLFDAIIGEADAHLIAAAPALLAALETLVSIVDDLARDGYVPDTSTTRSARAVIAEARGEADTDQEETGTPG